MRVLLIGEFSGFHLNLKYGLQECGIETVIAARMDMMRKIEIDLDLLPKSSITNKFLSKVYKGIYPFLNLKKLQGYDIVQFISPFLFVNKIQYIGLKYNQLLYDKILRQNKKSFFVSCGEDSVFNQIGKYLLKYNSVDPGMLDYPINMTNNNEALKWNLDLISKTKGIIPTLYDYQIGYLQLNGFKDKISNLIPMPLDTKHYPYRENQVKNGRIKFLHGVTRPHFKGTKYILSALEKLKTKYPNDVELVIVEKLPLNEYEEVIYNANVVLDQTNSYGYGMNALISMSKGRIVMSGAEQETIDSLNEISIPVININSNEDQIFNELLKIMENRLKIGEMGVNSRKFVEKHHEAKLVAKKYLQFWETQE